MTDLNNIWNEHSGKLSEEQLKTYLEGKLSPEEQHKIELILSGNDLESDAIEGLSNISKEKANVHVQHINRNLLRTLQNKRKKERTSQFWTWIAIIIVLFLCIAGYAVMHLMLKHQ